MFEIPGASSHRALADAEATLALLRIILKEYPKKYPHDNILNEGKETLFPKYLSYRKVAQPSRKGRYDYLAK